MYSLMRMLYAASGEELNPKLIKMELFKIQDSKISSTLVERSTLYQEFLKERKEILKHKWLESEKAGVDIGFEAALLDWIRKHRKQWKETRKDILN